MNKLVQRGITALFFVAVMLAALYYSAYSLLALFLLITVLGTWEYATLVYKYPSNKHENPFVHKCWLSTASAMVYLLISAVAVGWLPITQLAWIMPVVLLFFVKELYSTAPQPFARLGLNITGIAYLGVSFALINVLAHINGSFSPNIILGIYAISWLNDTGAYVTGRAIGKTPLFKRVSPNKTWEGTIGGIVFSLLVTALVVYLFNDFDVYTWYSIAAITIVSSIIGDLIESRLKRSLQVKDSGSLLPGHGGILDRFDAILFSVPWVYTYLILTKV